MDKVAAPAVDFLFKGRSHFVSHGFGHSMIPWQTGAGPGRTPKVSLTKKGWIAMKRIALTGGIASGKSTVSRLVSATGTPVVDADLLCRQVMAPGMPATLEIARRWPFAMEPDGVTIHRRRLGSLLFSDPELLKEETAIVLPRIQEAFDAWCGRMEREGHALCVYDAALVFEHGLEKGFDGVLLVSVPREIQLARVMARDGLASEEACRRIAAQMSLEEKERRATWTIRNDGGLEDLERRFRETWRQVMADLGVSPA